MFMSFTKDQTKITNLIMAFEGKIIQKIIVEIESKYKSAALFC